MAHVTTIVIVSTFVQIDPFKFKLLMQFDFSTNGQRVHHSSKATKAETGKLVNCNIALPT